MGAVIWTCSYGCGNSMGIIKWSGVAQEYPNGKGQIGMVKGLQLFMCGMIQLMKMQEVRLEWSVENDQMRVKDGNGQIY